jgi:hypothetical protein
MTADRPTRFASDLLESAAVEGKREGRSAKQQLDYWARVGRSVAMHQTAARRRVVAALADELPFSDLTEGERLVANADLDASIQMQAQLTSFGERPDAEGETTVALDDEGALVKYRPDGSRVVLVPPDSRE